MEAEVEFIQVFAAHGDNGGGISLGPVIGYFSTEFKAKDFTIDKGWYHGPGDVRQHPAVIIDDKVYLLVRDTPIDLDRKQAIADEILKETTLASLTDEQIRVLGLKK